MRENLSAKGEMKYLAYEMKYAAKDEMKYQKSENVNFWSILCANRKRVIEIWNKMPSDWFRKGIFSSYPEVKTSEIYISALSVWSASVGVFAAKLGSHKNFGLV